MRSKHLAPLPRPRQHPLPCLRQRPRLRALGLLAIPLLTLPALALAAGQAVAAEAVSGGARLAATCSACHGTNGVTVGNALPPLAGQARESLLASLKAFKSGTRPATIMTQLMKGYSDEQLVELAAFFATQKPPGAGS